MQIILYIFTFYIFSYIKCTPVSNKTRTQVINELEIERDKLYKQIKVAVEDSINTLQNNNDSDINEGVKYMKELREHLNTIDAVSNKNGINVLDKNNTLSNIFTFNIDRNGHDANGRRKLNKQYDNGYHRIKEALVELAKLTGGDDKTIKYNNIAELKKKLDKQKNRLDITEKLGSWVKQKEIEKQKIQAYKYKMVTLTSHVTTEKCPDYGVQRERNISKWPCCRKCCKSSYLGCLK